MNNNFKVFIFNSFKDITIITFDLNLTLKDDLEHDISPPNACNSMRYTCMTYMKSLYQQVIAKVNFSLLTWSKVKVIWEQMLLSIEIYFHMEHLHVKYEICTSIVS